MSYRTTPLATSGGQWAHHRETLPLATRGHFDFFSKLLLYLAPSVGFIYKGRASGRVSGLDSRDLDNTDKRESSDPTAPSWVPWYVRYIYSHLKMICIFRCLIFFRSTWNIWLILWSPVSQISIADRYRDYERTENRNCATMWKIIRILSTDIFSIWERVHCISLPFCPTTLHIDKAPWTCNPKADKSWERWR